MQTHSTQDQMLNSSMAIWLAVGQNSMMGMETGDRHRSRCKRGCQGRAGPSALVRTGTMRRVHFECYRLVMCPGQLLQVPHCRRISLTTVCFCAGELETEDDSTLPEATRIWLSKKVLQKQMDGWSQKA